MLLSLPQVFIALSMGTVFSIAPVLFGVAAVRERQSKAKRLQLVCMHARTHALRLSRGAGQSMGVSPAAFWVGNAAVDFVIMLLPVVSEMAHAMALPDGRPH